MEFEDRLSFEVTDVDDEMEMMTSAPREPVRLNRVKTRGSNWASGFTAALPSRRPAGSGRRGETRPRRPEYNESTVSLEKACRSKVKQGHPGETENADMVRPRGR